MSFVEHVFERVACSAKQACVMTKVKGVVPALAVGSGLMSLCFSHALLVDLGVEWLALPFLDCQLGFEVLLPGMHLRFVLERVLVEHFVLFLAGVQPVLVSLVVRQLVHHS